MTDGDLALEPGQVLSDRYRLEQEIGRGGAGRVFRGHDDRLDRAVAIKVLTDLGDAAVARFRREAATAARIRHPNVVTLHDAGVDGAPYLVMSLVAGPSLADRVEQDGPLDTEALQRLATDLFAGLDATHAAGVLHRDLTPRNVLFDGDGTALLADFGIARGPDDPTVTAEHTIMGTRPFVAPERLRGADATVATDVYAVGVTLRYAAVGNHALPIPDDHPFAPLVEACTAEDPSRRPTSAAGAGRLLEGLAPVDGALPPTETIEATPPPPVISPEIHSADTDAPTERIPAAPATPSRPEAPREHTTIEPVHRPDGRRPILVVGLLAGLAVAALVGSAAVRDSATPEGADGGATTDAPAATAPADPGSGDGAPTFDPGAPGDSARQLAEWIRTGR